MKGPLSSFDKVQMGEVDSYGLFFSCAKILKVKIHSLDLRDSELDAAWWEIYISFNLRESIPLVLGKYNIFQAYD